MSNPTIPLTGGVVFWSLGGATDFQKLLDGMTDAGFQQCAPDRVTIPEACKAGLTDLYGEKRTLIRPLPNGNGYAVVDETAGIGKALDHAIRIVAKWPMTGTASVQNMQINGPWGESQKIIDAIDKQLDVLPHNKVSSGLVAVVRALGGVPLKPAGGVYWLPPRALAAWHAVGHAVEAAGPGNLVQTMSVLLDDAGIRAAVEAIRTDIGTEIAALQEQAALGGDNKRSVRVRQEKAERLLDRVKDYEQILGVALTELRDGIDATQVVIVTAAASQMAEDMGDLFGNMPSIG